MLYVFLHPFEQALKSDADFQSRQWLIDWFPHRQELSPYLRHEKDQYRSQSPGRLQIWK